MRKFPDHYIAENGLFFPSQDRTTADFAYTDGEAFETRIEGVIASARDRSLFSSEISAGIWDWRSACHLSPVRANILRPLQEVCRRRVLELGAGCGIITRYLGELGGSVVALEGSARRAGVTRLRTADLENVSVVCDRIEDFDAREKFDVVTMIGVLQYARLYSNCEGRAELALLRNATRQLDEDGILVIAIQNPLGLKYFAGFAEPNVGTPYYGIEGRYSPKTIVRLGLREITSLLEEAGLNNHVALLPLPDYHMPTTILSGKGALPTPLFSGKALLAQAVGRDRARPDWSVPAFSLERAWDAVYENGLATELANAWIIVASRNARTLSFLQETPHFAWHYSVERHPAYATAKCFTRQGDRITVNSEYLTGHAKPAVPITHTCENSTYLLGRLWWSQLVEILNTPGWSVRDLGAWAKRWLDALCEQAGFDQLGTFPLTTGCPGSLFDLTPMNCTETPEGRLAFFDREWEVESSLPFHYLAIRGIFGSLVNIASCAPPTPGTSLNILPLTQAILLQQGCDIRDEHLRHYLEHEFRVQNWVIKGTDGTPTEHWISAIKEARLIVRLPQQVTQAPPCVRNPPLRQFMKKILNHSRRLFGAT
ncbi:MAG: class I SAM-dependent methyltransferase [Thiobacillus sp.]|nr:class I SAM-dependent methyltransferase [Thiobacillus sp.]